MVVVLGTLLIATLMSVAAFAAIDGDTPQARVDQDRKESYSAAEAGIAYYLDQLDRDNAYWTQCTNVPSPGGGQPSPVNQPWDGAGADPRTWRSIPSSDAQYTIELLPANGSSQCVAGNDATVIDATTGTFKIRATGRPSAAKPQRRSLIATFKRDTFLSYIYFTDKEAIDPALVDAFYGGGGFYCDLYKREGRPSGCDIQFGSGDVVKGPLHTNDELKTSCSATFGRTPQDEVTVSAPAPGWTGTESSGCSGGTPNFVGTFAAGSALLSLPPENSALKAAADSQYRFKGRTTIVINGGTMQVTNAAAGLTNASMGLPPNGVIYVDNNTGCTATYNALNPYNEQTACANVYVKGSYSQSLTIGSAQDIIVNGDLTRSGDSTLGLVANQFIRVYHPATHDSSDPFKCTTQSGAPSNITIHAAILSLKHSFLVDNYYCGSPRGTLTVDGAISQKFRGPVGTSGGTGYIKNYVYDDRLQRRSPPKFLDPVAAAWTVARQTEQSPAR